MKHALTLSVLACGADEAGEKMEPLVRGVEQFPSLKSGDTIEMLMPTAQWPFDHALLVAEVGGFMGP